MHPHQIRAVAISALGPFGVPHCITGCTGLVRELRGRGAHSRWEELGLGIICGQKSHVLVHFKEVDLNPGQIKSTFKYSLGNITSKGVFKIMYIPKLVLSLLSMNCWFTNPGLLQWYISKENPWQVPPWKHAQLSPFVLRWQGLFATQCSERSTGTAFSTSFPTASSTTPWEGRVQATTSGCNAFGGEIEPLLLLWHEDHKGI